MKKTIAITFLALVMGVSSTYSQVVSKAILIPIVGTVTATTAQISISADAQSSMTKEEMDRIHIEYFETNQVCIMIYPTPEHCKPKKTAPGIVNTTLTNLKPNTNYTVSFKRDNTIMCITTPCPGNEYQSASATFTTTPGLAVDPAPTFMRNLSFAMRGSDVITLQDILREKGYFFVQSTGYYGVLTRAAVRNYQINDMHITPTGTVGPKTRTALNASIVPIVTETFTGKITAVSTACFADGECSVSVDGKKVVTTIGWSQATVGSVRGVEDFGSLENRIGADVKVYAKKTPEGYTLYGDRNFYIEVL